MSIVEERILNRDFPYLHPYFYNHPYALRCELGMGSDEEYINIANGRALEIYNILFPSGADAIIFNHWLYDYCDSGDAESQTFYVDDSCEEAYAYRLKNEFKKLAFLSEQQFKYRHDTVRNLPTYDDSDDCERRNRVICYSDGIGFDYHHLIAQEIDGNGHEVSFVSFEHECIYSVYDDRGCDIVFMTLEKLREFYAKLQPYFLKYDVEEMEKRFNNMGEK